MVLKYMSVSDFNNSNDFRIRYKIKNGVPKVDYRFLDTQIGWQHNPVTVSQYALCLYDEYVNEIDEKKLEKFYKQVSWLENNVVAQGENILALPYNFPHRWYKLSAPWYSGMAQGQAASVFVRAFNHSGEKKYLGFAQGLLNFMLLPVEQGGTLAQLEENDLWIEECATDRPSLILNGHLFGLIGLIEFNIYSEKDDFKYKCEQLLTTTKKYIPKFEKDNWLIYALHFNQNPCSSKYMGIQAIEAKHIWKLTKDFEFKTIYERWNQYTDWAKFWEDINKQNKKSFYYYKNFKGYIKQIFPKLYIKHRLDHE